MRTDTRSLALIVVAATTAVLGAVATAGPAAAAGPPAGSFEVDYDVAGSSTIVRPNSTVGLGPAVSRTYIDNGNDGSFTADLALPPTVSTFTVLGLVPVSATVTFVPAGPVTGSISQSEPVRLTASASYYLKLTNVRAAGVPTFQGPHCRTVAPVTIPLATPAGQQFDLTEGGTLTGTYTIGAFANCGLTTALLNALVPGPGNTVSLTLSGGRFVP